MQEPYDIQARLYHDKDGPMIELKIATSDDQIIVVNMDIDVARRLKAVLQVLTGMQNY